MNFWVVCGYGWGHSLVSRWLTCAPYGGCMWQWAPPSALQNKTSCWKKISDKTRWCSGVGNVTRENIAESRPKWRCIMRDLRAQRKGTLVGMHSCWLRLDLLFINSYRAQHVIVVCLSLPSENGNPNFSYGFSIEMPLGKCAGMLLRVLIINPKLRFMFSLSKTWQPEALLEISILPMDCWSFNFVD